MEWFKRTFAPGGRTSRLGYWRFQLFAVLLFTPAWIATILATQANQPVIAAVVFAVSFAAYLAAIVLVCIRRVHDRNRSALWVVLLGGGPFACYAAGHGLMELRGTGNLLLAALFNLIGFGLGLWGFVEFGFLRGTRGPNSFGPEPVR